MVKYKIKEWGKQVYYMKDRKHHVHRHHPGTYVMTFKISSKPITILI